MVYCVLKAQDMLNAGFFAPHVIIWCQIFHAYISRIVCTRRYLWINIHKYIFFTVICAHQFSPADLIMWSPTKHCYLVALWEIKRWPHLWHCYRQSCCVFLSILLGYHGLYCRRRSITNACLLPVRITPHAETWSMAYECICAPQFTGAFHALGLKHVSTYDAWLMCCGLFQVSTVRYIRTPVWSCGARMEDAVRVKGEMCPVCVHQDIWVNITGYLHDISVFGWVRNNILPYFYYFWIYYNPQTSKYDHSCARDMDFKRQLYIFMYKVPMYTVKHIYCVIFSF